MHSVYRGCHMVISVHFIKTKGHPFQITSSQKSTLCFIENRRMINFNIVQNYISRIILRRAHSDWIRFFCVYFIAFKRISHLFGQNWIEGKTQGKLWVKIFCPFLDVWYIKLYNLKKLLLKPQAERGDEFFHFWRFLKTYIWKELKNCVLWLLKWEIPRKFLTFNVNFLDIPNVNFLLLWKIQQNLQTKVTKLTTRFFWSS